MDDETLNIALTRIKELTGPFVNRSGYFSAILKLEN